MNSNKPMVNAKFAYEDLFILEAENFQSYGGWVLDTQFVPEMGSPYLLAHGLGQPVSNATTKIVLPGVGRYRIWVRCKDWTAVWGVSESPGKFQLIINGLLLETIFGTKGKDWIWQDGGIVDITQPETNVELRDLTGFEGRCDAILFSKDQAFAPPDDPAGLERLRLALSGTPDQPDDGGSFDLVVVGGGIAGICAAISAARLGLKSAIIHDRPVLGGNNSSEVRVWLGGETNLEPYPRIGDIVRELEPAKKAHAGSGNTADIYEDGKRLALIKSEPRLTLFLDRRVIDAEMNEAKIMAVTVLDTRSGRRSRIEGRIFADCTGDGELGHLSGADFEMTLKSHMGSSNLWNVIDTGQPASFPMTPWALDLSAKPFPGRGKDTAQWAKPGLESLGQWFWESGFNWHPITQSEHARDWNFRAMYGAWNTLKNIDGLYPNHRLNWAAYIAGKRESRRLLGDVIIRKEDLLEGRHFDDACVPCTWRMDLHSPHPAFRKGFEEAEFIAISLDDNSSFPVPFWLPYRCLFSRNVKNLFMAGRDISVTHEALGSVRVMRTCGMMGEVIGIAASLAVRHKINPRGVHLEHWPEMQQLLTVGIPKKESTSC